MDKKVFDSFIKSFREESAKFPDKRVGKNSVYQIEDIVLSAFSMFHMQSSSFLSFQRTMEGKEGKNNANSLFGLKKIPTDNHIRDMLDEINPNYIEPLFEELVSTLKKREILKAYSYLDSYLVLLDGTGYHASKTISCEKCLTREYTKDIITYHHQAITPIIASPNLKRVIPLMPELIENSDGTDKQDCEINTSKRWLKRDIALDLPIILLGDDLYSREPFCKDTLQSGKSFIFVAKEESHKVAYEHIKFLDNLNELESHQESQGRAYKQELWKYKFVNEIPINSNSDALRVNWVSVEVYNKSNKRTYYNTFITNIEITQENVAQIAKAGRARWKIENENNNTLKTKGYHLEHNFGHGKKYLSGFLFTLNILAFLLHTVLNHLDENYAKARAKSTRVEFFNTIEILTRLIYFDSWDSLMKFLTRDRDAPLLRASDFK